jgi:pilus assembly protein CpaE
MSSAIPCLPTLVVVDADEDLRTLVRYAVEGHFELVGEGGTGEAAVEFASTFRPDLMLVDMDLPLLEGADATRVLAEQFPEIAVVVISAYKDFDRIRKAMAAGAKEFIAKPFAREELVDVLERTVQRHADRRETLGRTHDLPAQGLWCFLSPGGGMGKTSLALSMAHQLTVLGRKTLVVDLDPLFGNVSFYLGAQMDHPHMGDLLMHLEKQNASTLAAHIKVHHSGIRILAPPTDTLEAHGLEIVQINKLVSLLQDVYDYVLVDLPAGLPEDFLPFLDAARYLFVGSSLGYGAVKNLGILLSVLGSLDYPRGKIWPLILGYRGNTRRLREVELLLRESGEPLQQVIPADDRYAEEAVRRADPITAVNPAGEYALAVQEILARLLDLPPLQPDRGWLSGLLHRVWGDP